MDSMPDVKQDALMTKMTQITPPSFPLGSDDWDTVIRNPMLRLRLLRRLQETGTIYDADTEGVFIMPTFFHTECPTTSDTESNNEVDEDAAHKRVEDVARAQCSALLEEIFTGLSAEKVYTPQQQSCVFSIKHDWQDSVLEYQSVWRMPDNRAVSVEFGFGTRFSGLSDALWKNVKFFTLTIRVYGLSEHVKVLLERFRAVFSPLRRIIVEDKTKSDNPLVQFIQCLMTPNGLDLNQHEAQFPTWETQQCNYPIALRPVLQKLITTPSEDGSGNIIIFHGPPGCGKTWFLRTLFREWREQYIPMVVLDVENLLSSETYYLSLLSRTSGFAKKPLIVLEDAGQSLVRNGQYGVVPIQRLLNRSDGLCSGDRGVTFVITFNEDLGVIDPAVVRAGRCRANLNFPAMCRDSAEQWLTHHEHPELIPELKDHTTLADMFAMLREHGITQSQPTTSFGFTPTKPGVTGRSFTEVFEIDLTSK